MAQVRQADRGFPNAAIYLLAAVAAAIVVTAVIAAGTLNIFGPATPAIAPRNVDPAVLDAGRQWELERRAQGGGVYAVTQAGRDWEQQRRQQSGDSD